MVTGQKYPLPEELQILYPDGVWIKENGCPDFTPYAEVIVEVEGLEGDRTDDQKANSLAGFKSTQRI